MVCMEACSLSHFRFMVHSTTRFDRVRAQQKNSSNSAEVISPAHKPSTLCFCSFLQLLLQPFFFPPHKMCDLFSPISSSCFFDLVQSHLFFSYTDPICICFREALAMLKTDIATFFCPPSWELCVRPCVLLSTILYSCSLNTLSLIKHDIFKRLAKNLSHKFYVLPYSNKSKLIKEWVNRAIQNQNPKRERENAEEPNSSPSLCLDCPTEISGNWQ